MNLFEVTSNFHIQERVNSRVCTDRTTFDLNNKCLLFTGHELVFVSHLNVFVLAWSGYSIVQQSWGKIFSSFVNCRRNVSIWFCTKLIMLMRCPENQTVTFQKIVKWTGVTCATGVTGGTCVTGVKWTGVTCVTGVKWTGVRGWVSKLCE